METGPANITIGGKLPRSLVEDFLGEVASAQACIGQWDNDDPMPETEEELISALVDGRLELYDWGAAWSHFELLEGWCRDNGLSFDTFNEPTEGAYGGALYYFRPGMECIVCTSASEGEVTLSASSLVAARNAVREGEAAKALEILDGLLSHHERTKVPLLEIVDG